MVQSVLVKRWVVTQHSAAKLTYADYEQFPDDGLRHEIIEGEHYVSPSPSTRHQRILLNLSYLMQSYLQAHPVGEIFFAPYDVLLSEFNILVPDLIYISNERSELITAKNLQGSPDLVVEILSPSTRSRDKRLKRDVYERTGVGEYWVVDPAGDVVEVYRRSADEAESGTSLTAETFHPPRRYDRTQTLTTPLLSGLELPLDRILA
jgi:Uma2 family endonuclease